MNNELKEAKVNLRRIEKFCKSRPIPTEGDVRAFLISEKLEGYEDFATHTIKAVWAGEWLMHTKKINKSRI